MRSFLTSTSPPLQLAPLAATTPSYQIRDGSKRWCQNYKRIHEATENTNGDIQSNWEPAHVELPAGSSHYIIIDGVDEATKMLERAPLDTFRKQLITAFAKKTPSIGFVTLNTGTGSQTLGNGVQNLSNYVGGNLPLVLLDSRDRPPEAYYDLDSARDHLIKLEAELNEEGHVDCYAESNWSLLHTVLKEHRKADKVTGNKKGVEIYKGEIAEPIDELKAFSLLENVLLRDSLRSPQVIDEHWKTEEIEEKVLRGLSSSTSREAGSSSQGEEDMIRKAIEIVKELEKLKEKNDSRMRTEFETCHLNLLKEPMNFDDLDELLLSETLRWVKLIGVFKPRYDMLVLGYPDLFGPKELFKPRVGDEMKVLSTRIVTCNREGSFEDAKAIWLELIGKWKTETVCAYRADPMRSKEYMACFEVRSYKELIYFRVTPITDTSIRNIAILYFATVSNSFNTTSFATRFAHRRS